MSVIDIATKSLKLHEGFRDKAYTCTAGKLTIGYGLNLEARGLTEKEAEYILQNCINECLDDLETRTYWDELTDIQKAGLVDLRYNLGASGFRQFKKMEAALVSGNYAEAALQIMDSSYANQVGKRADNVAGMVQGFYP